MDSDSKFKKALKVSLALHVFILLFALGFTLVNKLLINLGWVDDPLETPIGKRSIRVDVVDLPSQRIYDMENIDLTKKPAVKNPAPPETKKEEKKVSDTAMKLPTKEAAKKEEKKTPPKVVKKGPSPKERKNKLDEIRNRLRADAKRQELVAEMEEEDTGADTREAVAGNIESKGGSNTGDIASTEDEYISIVQSHVLKYWRAPGWMISSDKYTARISVKLAPDGSVLSKKFIYQSGEPQFDDSAERAIDAADPFPVPPAVVKRKVLQEGIVIGFPL